VRRYKKANIKIKKSKYIKDEDSIKTGTNSNKGYLFQVEVKILFEKITDTILNKFFS